MDTKKHRISKKFQRVNSKKLLQNTAEKRPSNAEHTHIAQ